jgi:hypothetical protein
MRKQDFKILKPGFYLPILCLALCCSTKLIAAPSVSPAGSVSVEALTPASPTPNPTITFTNKSGMLITDAEVVRTNDGVSLVWEKDGGASGGVVRLEDLPPALRDRFGYDPAKTAAADELERQRRIQWQEAVAARAAQIAKKVQATTNQIPSSVTTNNSSTSYSKPKRPPSHINGGKRLMISNN